MSGLEERECEEERSREKRKKAATKNFEIDLYVNHESKPRTHA